MILGIDEVGRGPWAGPLVVGAVVLGGQTIIGLTDSKKLSKKKREEMSMEIHRVALSIGLGWVHADEIDEIGLAESLKLATIRAVEQIDSPYHEIIIDGTINFLAGTGKGQYVTTMKKADLLVPSVSAASIVAKVARDAYMADQDDVHQGYKFASHVGYGTSAHRSAIEKLGVTPLHRLSFAPLAKYRQMDVGETKVKTVSQQTTKHIGDEAEDCAALYLEKNGHRIIARNWKTKYCEIDIVTWHEETLYFTEVKYRENESYGNGFDAITAQKQRKMRFAAEMFMKAQGMYNTNAQLAAMSLSKKPIRVNEWIVV